MELRLKSTTAQPELAGRGVAWRGVAWRSEWERLETYTYAVLRPAAWGPHDKQPPYAQRSTRSNVLTT